MAISRRAKRVILGFTFLVVLVVFIFVSSARFVAGMREKQRYEQERAELKPPLPNVHEVRVESHPRVRSYAAELMPWMEANVPAEAAGRVIAVPIEAGTQVKQGDVLAQLDETRARILLASALARHEEMQRLLAEGDRLRKSNVVSQTQYEAILAENRVTQANLEEAQDNLLKHTIRAPFDGFVNERLVDVGDAVNLNQPVATVVDLDQLRVIFSVSEQDLSAFTIGKKLDLRLLAYPEKTFHPEIRFLSRSADPGTRLFRVEAVLDNDGHDLPGGLQGRIEAEVERFANLPVVPGAAVRFRGRNAMVLKETGAGEPEWTTIQIGPELDGVFPVMEGLSAGDRILIR